jgi:two-component system sensor histidine kinase/response regulator
MNAHITKPIHVESMLRTMAQWIVGPGAAAPEGDSDRAPGTSAPSGEVAAINTAAGLLYCMGNESLYHRLLKGFRDAEVSFVAELNVALAEGRWGDALRRSHDMKGLAGTIGAQTLFGATQALHTQLLAQHSESALAQIEHVSVELERVLHDIDTLAVDR